MNRALRNVGWRYLLRHPWQTSLMILGIALGVSVMVAIDLANSAASRAFDLSTDAIAGRATHQIIGGPGAFVVTADGRDSFSSAVRRKLILEIACLTPDQLPLLAEAPSAQP